MVFRIIEPYQCNEVDFILCRASLSSEQFIFITSHKNWAYEGINQNKKIATTTNINDVGNNKPLPILFEHA